LGFLAKRQPKWLSQLEVMPRLRQITMTSLAPRCGRIGLASFALASLSFAIITAPSRGPDLETFQAAGRYWLDGTYEFGVGMGHLYPPFSVVLFAPLALLPFSALVWIWLALNVFATAVVLYLGYRLWGQHWSKQTQLLFAALFVSWPAYRVTLRNGQISVIVLALLLGAILARRRAQPVIAGALLGLALLKYSLTLPFLAYFLVKRQWKMCGVALATVALLTQVFGMRLGLSAFEATRRYVEVVGRMQAGNSPGYTGTTEFSLLASSVFGTNVWTAVAAAVVAVIGLLAVLIASARNDRREDACLSALSVLALWSAYHRNYDEVICITVVAFLINLSLGSQRPLVPVVILVLLNALLILGLPGLLTSRFGISTDSLSGNPAGWLGLHCERIVLFLCFWWLVALIWTKRTDAAGSPQSSVKAIGNTMKTVSPRP